MCLWLAFGTGNTFRYLDAMALAQAFGDDKAAAFPALHAFTGCDVTSAFAGRANTQTGLHGMILMRLHQLFAH